MGSQPPACLKIDAAIDIARGPLMRTIPMPPSPGGVEMAAIVSSRLLRIGVFRLLVLAGLLLVFCADGCVFLASWVVAASAAARTPRAGRAVAP